MIFSEFIWSASLALLLVANPTGEERYRKAIEKIDAAEYDEAAELLRAAIRTLRGDALANARFELARIDTDPVQAGFELQSLLTAAPSEKKPALALALGELHLLLGDPASAASVFAEARLGGKNPTAERASFLQALALFRAARYEEARAAWSDYLIDFLEGEWQASARVGIAAVNEKLGRSRESVEIYKAVLAQHPGCEDEPWILSRLVALLKESDPQESRRTQERLGKDYPLYPGESSVTPSATGAPPATVDLPRRASPTVTVSPRGRFLIQAGVFRDPANAENLRARLTDAELPCILAPRGELTVVAVGPFADNEKAAAVLPRVEEVIGEKPRIIRRND